MTRARRATALLCALLAACGMLASAGCSLAGATTPAPFNPGTHVISWIAQDTHDIAQVWASVDDAPPRQITHRVGSQAGCGTDILGAPMFAPDLRHIAVASGSTCGSGQITGPLYVVDAATGASISVPLPSGGTVLTNQRAYGWVDAHTLFALGDFGTNSGGALYPLGAAAATPLPGLPSAIPEGVARGTTLFYVTTRQTNGSVGAGTTKYALYDTRLARYDLVRQTSLPGTVDLGTFALCSCSTGDWHLPGWDASTDGAHIAYQLVAPAAPASALDGLTTREFVYANSDGSAPTQILKALVTTARTRMRFSPDGKIIGVTEAFTSPDVASGCVNTIGIYGDPCMQFYGPDAYSYPAWHYDSRYLVAATAPPGLAAESSLYRYTPSRFHGVAYAASGYNCWSTP
jgi:hypothetical protein